MTWWMVYNTSIPIARRKKSMPNRVSLIHVEIPMTEPFRISSGEVRTKEAVLIRIEMDGIQAWGEASPMAGGFYSSETPDSSWAYLSAHAIPRLLQSRNFHPEFVARELLAEECDRFAAAGLEGALWDLTVQREAISFTQALGVEYSPVASGLAVGIYPTIDRLIQACERYLADGYRRLKIKIQPGWDVEPLREIRRVFGEIPLMVDANAAYTPADFPVFEQLDGMGLLMIEQPLAKDDLEGHRRLQARLSTPVCLDESASSPETVRRAIEMEACRIVNVKIQRLGGIQKAREVIELCAARGIPTWMGTMPELGLASLHALYLALHPNCTYPTDVEASRRWYQDDIIDPPITVRDGWINIPPEHHARPRIDTAAVDRYRKRAAEWYLECHSPAPNRIANKSASRSDIRNRMGRS